MREQSVKYIVYGAIATIVLIVAILAMKAHMARKDRFLTACQAEHSAFECQYRWDTLMARERAAVAASDTTNRSSK